MANPPTNPPFLNLVYLIDIMEILKQDKVKKLQR